MLRIPATSTVLRAPVALSRRPPQRAPALMPTFTAVEMIAAARLTLPGATKNGAR